MTFVVRGSFKWEAFRKDLENVQFISKALYTSHIINTSNYYVS